MTSSFITINITFFNVMTNFNSLTVTSFVICRTCTNHVQYIAENYHCIFIDLWSYIMVLTFLIRILDLHVYITIYLPVCDTKEFARRFNRLNSLSHHVFPALLQIASFSCVANPVPYSSAAALAWRVLSLWQSHWQNNQKMSCSTHKNKPIL